MGTGTIVAGELLKGVVLAVAALGMAHGDLQVQGEYAGEVTGTSGKLKYGIQVIARGGGEFVAVGYPGGLPGDGGTKYENREPAKGRTADGVTRFPEFEVKSFQGSLVIRDGVLTIRDGEGDVLGRLKRTVRKSPTLGKKPPPGAIVLFDGRSAENFVSTKDGKQPAQMTEDRLLSAYQGRRRSLFSKREFQSTDVHLEFRLPYEPANQGQKRANSGCYLQGRYEVQILDSFGHRGRDNECGGIYRVGEPKVNMCFPPLAWQTYDIEFTAPVYDKQGTKLKNAVMTVYHNGVLIQEKVEVPTDTTAAPFREGPSSKPLYLQNHGHPVHYRNIWVVERKP